MPSRTEDPPRTRPAVATGSISPSTPAPASPPVPRMADEELVAQDSFRAILSSHQRAGRWEAADVIDARAILGEVVLDFTRAVLPPSGVVDIDARAIGGEVRIVVPDGAEVEIEGTPILGSIEQLVRRKGAGERIREWVTGEREEDLPAPPAPPEPPLFRIEARAICGSVKVTGR